MVEKISTALEMIAGVVEKISNRVRDDRWRGGEDLHRTGDDRWRGGEDL
ncbi:MAG: hypothetical protein JNM83_05875 [Myxococcales bacterium]|nr:hypothetical protein [Myxococcales bacterium]